MSKKKGIIRLVVLLAVIAFVVYTAVSGLGSDRSGSLNDISLGLDLRGGVSITYEAVGDVNSQDMSDTKAKLEKRVQDYSTEAQVYFEGSDRITVDIPGATDANAVLQELGKPGTLIFCTDSSDPEGTKVMDGNQIKDAQAGATSKATTNAREYVVNLTLTSDGVEAFSKATEELAPTKGRIYIMYNGEVLSAPTVNEHIASDTCSITGMGDLEAAQTLASNIRIGALPVQLQEMRSQVVGAKLGQDAVRTSLMAGVIGLILVFAFMIIYYRIPGLAASIALVMYTAFVIVLLSAFNEEITLTLPGIAGIILGIGMAVDANCIIFARIREEIATGKSVQTSMKIGFQKAMSAILDGNITTLIASVVLMALGSGTVKGFAYTLMIGIILSLFTAMVVTRYILYSLYALGLKSEKLYGRAKERKSIDFIGKKAVFFTISGIIIAAGLISMGVHSATEGKALNYGLDFMGGTSTTADFGKDMTIEDIENDIIPYVEKVTGDSDVQATKVEGTTQVTIKTRTLSLDERQELEDTLAENCDVDASTITSQSISSTISGEMRSDALKAVIVSCIFMLLYIWFRFKDIRFAASAILALVHDVLVVITVYALVRISVGSTFIACVLTIVGYSINDTIVIFDRIRENLALKTGKQTAEELREVANKSLTQTLSRSINTSITTFIMVVMLYILGVASIRDFSLPLMAGLVCGAYSSICIATELWYVMKVHLGKNKATK